MDILKEYLRQYWKLLLLALFLAATNQVFSLLDPLIFRHIIDEYATKFTQYTTGTVRARAYRSCFSSLSVLRSCPV
jgi:ABC-type multidrug transport system fused ATPase/permease subunit